MKLPELESQLQLGDDDLYVFEIEAPGSRSFGNQSGVDALDTRWILTCHDDNGNEVEIRFTPDDEDND